MLHLLVPDLVLMYMDKADMPLPRQKELFVAVVFHLYRLDGEAGMSLLGQDEWLVVSTLV